ncbi:extracellular matrix-binding protein EbhA-like [Aethina tumida]|uniref:extracellular matrix-binding protein EbhA-like n=1 Tax=Aethina tumida TaxID=116153 RepID=UPI00096B1240|nr:extracellular matrix-binding protein EbhA-like [Aethina tumida]
MNLTFSIYLGIFSLLGKGASALNFTSNLSALATGIVSTQSKQIEGATDKLISNVNNNVINNLNGLKKQILISVVDIPRDSTDSIAKALSKIQKNRNILSRDTEAIINDAFRNLNQDERTVLKGFLNETITDIIANKGRERDAVNVLKQAVELIKKCITSALNSLAETIKNAVINQFEVLAEARANGTLTKANIDEVLGVLKKNIRELVSKQSTNPIFMWKVITAIVGDVLNLGLEPIALGQDLADLSLYQKNLKTGLEERLDGWIRESNKVSNVQGIKALYEDLNEVIDNNATSLSNSVATAIRAVIDNLQVSYDNVSDALDRGLSSLPEQLKNNIKHLLGSVVPGVIKAAQSVGESQTYIKASIKSHLEDLINYVKGVIVYQQNNLKAKVADAVTDLYLLGDDNKLTTLKARRILRELKHKKLKLPQSMLDYVQSMYIVSKLLTLL